MKYFNKILAIAMVVFSLVITIGDKAYALTDYTDPTASYPAAWPDGLWMEYRYDGIILTDKVKNADESTGGTNPAGSNIDVSDGVNTATFVYADGVNVFFRFRLSKSPIGSGGISGLPYATQTWVVLIDYDADGFSEFAIFLDGASGGNGTETDDIVVMWHDTPFDGTPSQNYDDALDTVWRQDSVKHPSDDSLLLVDGEPGANLAAWDSDPDPDIYDFIRTRVTENLDGGNEAYVDIQIPLAALDASALLHADAVTPGPALDADSWFSYGFSTAASATNPFQKDVVYDGCYTPGVDDAFPFGDVVSASGDLIQQPVFATEVTVDACSNNATLTAEVMDTLTIVGSCTGTTTVANSISTVDFYYYYDEDGNGSDDDGYSWVYLASGTPYDDPVTVTVEDVGPWEVTGVDFTSFQNGEYLLKSIATDNNGNITDSADIDDTSSTYNPGTNGTTPVVALFTINCGVAGFLVSGYVYNDKDTSSTKDAGEDGLGVTAYVKMCDAAGTTPIVNTTVDSDTGFYAFMGVTDATTYTLYESADNNNDCVASDPAGWNSVSPADNTLTVTMAGANLSDNNFGDTGVGISGYVYFDENANSTKDIGEAGLQTEVYVELCLSGVQQDLVQADATTGFYEFFGLTPGTYTLLESADTNVDCTESDPAGFTSTAPADNTITATIVASNLTDQNFGDTSLKVSGYVFNDLNNDTVNDAGENGLGSDADVYVKLLDATSTTVLDVVQADPTTGYYEILGLTSGTTYNLIEDYDFFTVDVIPGDPLGWTSSTSNTITLTTIATSLTDQDFGDYSYQLSGYIFNDDVTVDGTKEAGEDGLGVSVYVKLIDSLGTVRKVTTADTTTGFYYFEALWADTFKVIVDDNDSTIDTTANGPWGWTPSSHAVVDTLADIIFTGTTHNTDNNLGYTTYTISGVVFGDANGDGVKDAGETTGLGVGSQSYVKLCPDGGSVPYYVVAADLSTGIYSITGVATATAYDLIESSDSTLTCTAGDPTGWLSTYDTDGVGNGYNHIDIASISVDLTNQDFGDAAIIVSGFVYNDEDLNNAKNGAEAGLGSTAYVKMCDTAGTGHINVATADNSTGYYEFRAISDATYTLYESGDNNADCISSDPSGWASTAPADNTLTVTVSGSSVTGNNFGDYILGYAVSGYVFNDANHDTTKNLNESGLGVNAYVKLCDTTATTYIDQAAANTGTGYYEFTAVTDGNYILVESSDTSLTCTASDPATWISTTDNTISITMDGVALIDKNFGDYNGSVIRGFVFNDKGDGTSASADANNTVFDTATETAIQTVKVQGCTDQACTAVVDSTYTNASGEYAIYLPTATVADTTVIYIVEDDLNGYLSSGNSILGVTQNDSTATTTLRNELTYTMTSGEEKTDYNFGDVKNIVITPNQSYIVSPGVGLFITHRININTPGKISIMTATQEAWNYAVYEDANCDEVPDGNPLTPVGGFYRLNGGGDFQVGQTCTMLKTIVPSDTPDGLIEKLTVLAFTDWLNTAGNNGDLGLVYDDSDLTQNTITVSRDVSGSLSLSKWVRNFTQSGAFAKTNSAEPCEQLEYRIDYKNIGVNDLSTIIFADIVPDGTTVSENLYNGNTMDTEVEYNSILYYGEIDAATPDGVDLNSGTFSIDLFTLTSPATALVPGGQGYFKYIVDLNCL